MAGAHDQKVQGAVLQLPNPITKDSSLLFVKRLTGAAVSHIAYARNLFNEADFIDKSFEGINIKVIRGLENNSEEARCLSSWLSGAFDAIERGYLKTLILEIREKRSDSERLLETYSFWYTYVNGEVHCSIESSSQKEHHEVSGRTRDEVRVMLRNVLVMTTALKSLPPDCVTAIKIAYYDEVTPADYEPPNFKSFSGLPAEFDSKTIKYNCREVKTPFHTMTIKIRSLENPKGTAVQSSSKVDCLCGINDSVSNQLQCEICSSFQHPACYKMFISEVEASQLKHTCAQCAKMPISADFEPENCIFRRVLTECGKSKSVSVRSLMRAIDLVAEATLTYMRRLQREGVLPKSLPQPFSIEKPDYTYNVNKSKMRELKKSYFIQMSK